VDKNIVAALQRRKMGVCGLYEPGFLPTMKFQLSQLPMIVGSGRVTSRRALFSCLRNRRGLIYQALVALR